MVRISNAVLCLADFKLDLVSFLVIYNMALTCFCFLSFNTNRNPFIFVPVFRIHITSVVDLEISNLKIIMSEFLCTFH